jgi:hypothetical protein
MFAMVFPSPESSPILTRLLALFDQLELAGVTGHEYVDYLFDKYPRLTSLRILDSEIELEQIGILERMRDKPDVKEKFSVRLIEIQRKLRGKS